MCSGKRGFVLRWQTNIQQTSIMVCSWCSGRHHRVQDLPERRRDPEAVWPPRQNGTENRNKLSVIINHVLFMRMKAFRNDLHRARGGTFDDAGQVSSPPVDRRLRVQSPAIGECVWLNGTQWSQSTGLGLGAAGVLLRSNRCVWERERACTITVRKYGFGVLLGCHGKKEWFIAGALMLLFLQQQN